MLRAGFVILLLIGTFVGTAFWNAKDSQVLSGHTRNEELPTAKPAWPGNPVDQHGRFINHEFPFLPKTLDLLKWQLSRNTFAEQKKNDRERLEVRDPSEFLASERDGILWLGHASFFIRLNGLSLLTDPVFGDPTFVRRYVDVPSPLEKIRQVDYVLLSHDHRDHMDEKTLTAMARKFPNARFLAGLRSEDVLGDWKSESNPVSTAGWFQQFALPNENLKIYFLPVRHWSRRGLFDTNWRLWGGYVIQSEKATIYFGGDSGYGRHYRETGELFPEIDYFLIGIGAYEPRWFMEPNHNNPSDVLKAYRDIGAKTLVPMHYGTFDLSDEPPSAPLRTLLVEAEKLNLRDRIRPLAINQSIDIE